MKEDNKSPSKIHKPDIKEKLFFLISGIIISVPFSFFFGMFADYLCFVLPIFYAQLCSIAILTPFIEEFAKVYPLFYRHSETTRSIFILGFLVGLGFGIAEFIVYITILEAPIYLRIPGLVFHAASTSIVAFGIATRNIIPFYLLAVFLHFSNNFFAFFGDFWFIGGIFALLLTYIISWRLYKYTSDDISKISRKPVL